MALHCAASKGNLSLVKLLIKDKEHVNKLNNYGITALHCAAEKGFIDIVKCLVSSGADIHIRGGEVSKNTPLLLAYWNGHLELVEYLVKMGGNITNSPILYKEALKRDVDFGRLDWLIKLGANLNMIVHDDGDTLLHVAIGYGKYLELVKYILNRGGDTCIKNIYGLSPLHMAVIKLPLERCFGNFWGKDRLYLVHLLIEYGADINAKDINMHTPIEYAYDNGRWSIAYYLVKQGADVSQILARKGCAYLGATNGIVEHSIGCPLLHDEASDGNVNSVRFLIRNGADVHVSDSLGNPPLYYAFRSGQLKMAKFLVENCANIRERDVIIHKVYRDELMNSQAINGISELGGYPETIVVVYDFLIKIIYFSDKVTKLGGWRPWNSYSFPYKYRLAIRTIGILAKSHAPIVDGKTIIFCYPSACLNLLPEELLQEVFAYITSGPVPTLWIDYPLLEKKYMKMIHKYLL